MAPISFVIDILLRWVMMLRTRMTRRSGGCRWRSNVRETRRRCGRRDRDWSCRVTVWQTQPAPETNLPAWATLTLTVMKTSLRRRRRLWSSNSQTRWPSDRRSASHWRCWVRWGAGDCPWYTRCSGSYRIVRDCGPGLPGHGDTEHAHLAPPHPRLPSRSRTSWPSGPRLSEARGGCVLCFVGVTTSVNISALVVSCHSNNSDTIPARIIQQWNFNKYWVSRLKLCSGNSQVYETWTRLQHIKRKWRNFNMLYSSDLSC